MKVSRLLCYQYVGSDPDPHMLSLPERIESKWMQREDVERLFAADPRRKKRFLRFLEKGMIGLALIRDAQWVTYAWMSVPYKSYPVHLPAFTKKWGAYWIFYCQTKESERKKGLYKHALRQLIRFAYQREQSDKPLIYIDTHEENIPSRKAILYVGFHAAGVMDVKEKTVIPRLWYVTKGTYWKREAHPLLPTSAQGLAVASIKEQEEDVQTCAGKPCITSPLELEGWIQFNRMKWGVTPIHVQYRSCDEPDSPKIHAIHYLNKKGQIYFPPRNPYTAIQFRSTCTDKIQRKYSQWLEVSKYVLEELSERKLQNHLVLPAEMQDIRPFTWAGYKAEVRYTFCAPLPVNLQDVSGQVRNMIRKAQKLGYTCVKTTNIKDAMECLEVTEVRYDPIVRLHLEDLEQLQDLMGEEFLRTYVVYSGEGEPVSAQMILHYPGCQALAWVNGNKPAHIRNGIRQLLDAVTLEDVRNAGASSYDFGGANIQSIANAKMYWGGQLTPYYVITPPSPHLSLRMFRDWLQFVSRVKGGVSIATNLSTSKLY